jgi:hypothetical protein
MSQPEFTFLPHSLQSLSVHLYQTLPYDAGPPAKSKSEVQNLEHGDLHQCNGEFFRNLAIRGNFDQKR